MNNWIKENISELMVECGRIAIKHYDKPITDYKRDHSVVTQADKEIEHHLERHFDQPDEGSHLLGEETLDKRSEAYIEAAFAQTAWVVDPIDGTSLYANHLPDWGISIGFMQQGLLKEGAVYFPLQDELFITERGALFHGSPAAPSRIEGVRRPYSHGGIIAITQEIARSVGMEVENPVYAGGSAVFPLTQLVLGRFIAYVGQVNLWDAAGALPLLINAGFRLQLEEGSPVSGRVDEHTYFLKPGEPKRWRYRSCLICAGATDAVAVAARGLAAARARRR